MALHISDKLSKNIGIKHSSPRLINLTWVIIVNANYDYRKININQLSRDALSDFLDQNTEIKIIVQNLLQRELVPAKELEWLTDVSRQSKFIEVFLSTKMPYQLSPYEDPSTIKSPIILGITPFDLIGSKLSSALIDYWLSFCPGDMNTKIQLVKLIRKAWEDQIKIDEKFDWFNKEKGQDRRDFFWQWLTLSEPLLTQNKVSFKTQDDLLYFFDFAKISENEKHYLVQKFKNNWNQKQYRERNAGKKQCNFILSEKTISKLERLAQKYHLSRTEIVELIINAEAAKEIYISERLNQRKLLKPQESDE